MLLNNKYSSTFTVAALFFTQIKKINYFTSTQCKERHSAHRPSLSCWPIDTWLYNWMSLLVTLKWSGLFSAMSHSDSQPQPLFQGKWLALMRCSNFLCLREAGCFHAGLIIANLDEEYMKRERGEIWSSRLRFLEECDNSDDIMDCKVILK